MIIILPTRELNRIANLLAPIVDSGLKGGDGYLRVKTENGRARFSAMSDGLMCDVIAGARVVEDGDVVFPKQAFEVMNRVKDTDTAELSLRKFYAYKYKGKPVLRAYEARKKAKIATEDGIFEVGGVIPDNQKGVSLSSSTWLKGVGGIEYSSSNGLVLVYSTDGNAVHTFTFQEYQDGIQHPTITYQTQIGHIAFEGNESTLSNIASIARDESAALEARGVSIATADNGETFAFAIHPYGIFMARLRLVGSVNEAIALSPDFIKQIAKSGYNSFSVYRSNHIIVFVSDDGDYIAATPEMANGVSVQMATAATALFNQDRPIRCSVDKRGVQSIVRTLSTSNTRALGELSRITLTLDDDKLCVHDGHSVTVSSDASDSEGQIVINVGYTTFQRTVGYCDDTVTFKFSSPRDYYVVQSGSYDAVVGPMVND